MNKTLTSSVSKAGHSDERFSADSFISNTLSVNRTSALREGPEYQRTLSRSFSIKMNK